MGGSLHGIAHAPRDSLWGRLFMAEHEHRSQVVIPFELLPEGERWKVGHSYRVRLVLRQVRTGEQDATFEVVDAVSLENGGREGGRTLPSDGGYIRV